MAWIESHQGLQQHPKTLKLATLMAWDIPATIGRLHILWWWCLEYAPDGNVSRHSTDITALAMGIPAELGPKLIQALYESEFLDITSAKQYLIHDWMQYAGAYLKNSKYRRNPEKIQEIIALYSTIVNRQSTDSQPKKRRKSTVPTNLTNQPTNQPAEFVFLLPDWIPKITWDAYEEMRAKKKKIPTDNARDLIVQMLVKLQSQGNDPIACLEQSIRNGWTDVYEQKGGNNYGTKKKHNTSTQPEAKPGKYAGLGVKVNV
jgi:hypothetical protein